MTVVGAFGYSQLGVDRFPKVDFPTITVTTRQPGAAPEQIETEISDKIEEAVNTISGLDELRSTSAEGVSIVTASFLLEKDVDAAAQEVRDKVSTILSQLPVGTDAPIIDKVDLNAMPVMQIAVPGQRQDQHRREDRPTDAQRREPLHGELLLSHRGEAAVSRRHDTDPGAVGERAKPGGGDGFSATRRSAASTRNGSKARAARRP